MLPSFPWTRLLRCAGVLVILPPLSPATAEEPPPIARLFSGSVREMEARLAAVRAERNSLSVAPSISNGGSLGFHALGNTSYQDWVLVDLGKPRPLEAIVLVPVNIAYAHGGDRDYGFPHGFRVEVSLGEDFENSHLVADTTRQPLANPTPAVVLDAEDISARFVRVTVTEPWQMPGTRRSLFALGELLVFSNGRNIAPGTSVTASRSTEAEPMWSIENLVDGQSVLGNPTTPETATLNGYHSQIETSPSEEKWVQIDLGEATVIEEVRILPARPIDWAESHGFGFPPCFRVESSLTPGFSDTKILLDRTDAPFPNPGDNPIVIPLEGVKARYVRFTATQLWKRGSDYVFALAELQVFRNGKNIAEGAPVTALDEVDVTSWANEALVDGFDSRHRLENDELQWIKGVVRQQRLSEEADVLELGLRETIGRVITRLILLASASGVTLFGLLGFTVLRSRVLRQRETDLLRARIASDLHDEIGSNLGSIALLSEIGGGPDDLVEINRVACETAASMHDIAWVIRSGHDTLDDLLHRMREVAAAMLKKIDHSFTVTPEAPPAQKISLVFKRNTLLFYKEALHNVMRHSGATRAGITVALTRKHFVLDIHDNGLGFDPAVAESLSGSGLKNLRKRAASLHGIVTINSSPSQGTTITLKARFP